MKGKGERVARFDSLIAAVAAEPDHKAALTLLLRRLAEEIRGTSNDQNIQKLSRELMAAAPALGDAVGGVALPGAAA
jgi:hypothetical protein